MGKLVKGHLPVNIKKIKRMYCWFCKIEVDRDDATKPLVSGTFRYHLNLCPRCGGRLTVYNEAAERRFYTIPMGGKPR